MSALSATPKTRKSILGNLFKGIRNKLIAGLVILVALALAVGLTAIVNQFQQLAEINGVLNNDIRLSQSESLLLTSIKDMRSAEQSLLLSKDTIGVSAAKAQYFDDWLEATDEAEAQCGVINSIEALGNVNATLQQCGPLITDYRTAYESTLDLITQLGALGVGLQGDYTRQTIGLDNTLAEADRPELTTAFLTARRSEAQFLLKNDTVFLEQTIEHLNELQLLILSDSELPSELTTELGTRLSAHRGAFSAIAAMNIEIEQATAAHRQPLDQLEQLVETGLDTSLIGVEAARASVNSLVTRGTLLILTLTAIAVVSGIVLSRLLSSRLTAQSEALLQFFSDLDDEQLDSRAKVVSSDELGFVAHTLNSVLDERGDLIQSTSARNQVETSIYNLILDMEAVAAGDLTKEAVVSGDVTGAVADSFNFMLEQLREVITTVQSSSLHLSSSANEIQTTAEHLSQGSEMQVEQILDTTAAIDEMSVSIQEVSRNSTISSNIGEQARATAEKGSQAVQEMVDDLDQIRQQVDRTVGFVSQLGTDAVELSDIVNLINAITERTSVLALNAAIQASARGKRGLGFDAVAEQVDSLANQSAETTREIDALIQLIQIEAESANEAIVNTRTEVVQGLALANEAGERLLEIESVSAKLSDLIQAISQAAQQQARGSESIARSMNEIATISQSTAATTKDATVSLENLAQMADELRQSAGRFKLN